ncbi:MAG: hypothetical protein LKJ76_09100 [Lachnospiraceae bacterium]|nr:hypothetical protein [Lachnospiraceae bacterium]
MNRGGEILNQRCRYLRTLRKSWIVPAAAAAGALVFWLCYTAVTAAFPAARSYEAVSKLYIDFAKDESGQVYDYYNGATWSDLLTADPDISDVIVQELPAGCDLDTVRSEVKAEILTDIRVMTVTVTDGDPGRAEAINTAVNDALVHFGSTAREFEDIRLMSTQPAKLVTWSDRTRNAVLAGLFLGAAAGIFLLLTAVTLDDAVYVPEDCERRYGLPVLGVRVRRGQEPTPEELAELAADTERLGAQGATAVRPGEGVPDYGKLRSTGAVLELAFGKRNGTQTEHLLSELGKQGVTVKGIVITDADRKFLDRYYRRAGSK